MKAIPLAACGLVSALVACGPAPAGNDTADPPEETRSVSEALPAPLPACPSQIFADPIPQADASGGSFNSRGSAKSWTLDGASSALGILFCAYDDHGPGPAVTIHMSAPPGTPDCLVAGSGFFCANAYGCDSNGNCIHDSSVQLACPQLKPGPPVAYVEQGQYVSGFPYYVSAPNLTFWLLSATIQEVALRARPGPSRTGT
jgi:hypothetical protein